ncbi:MAG: histidinol dehydrogenase [Planctomycetota bacterium]
MSISIIAHDASDYAARVEALLSTLRGGGLTAADERDDLDVRGIVAGIIARVTEQGDDAVVELTRELDRAPVEAATLRVTPEEIAAAHAAADPTFLALIREAAANIRAYQEHIKVVAPADLVRDGRRLGVRYTPIDRVAVYVPGGRALYPSTVLMTAVPAQVAGVREIVMASPPTGGDINPLALALAGELGITEVYRSGGAVAMAALALGTERIGRVDKVVGPGNAFVAEAKRQLFGQVGIDSIAGPSEVLIVADASADPQRVAADLLAQAEHDPGSAILATPDGPFAEAVAAALEDQLAALARAAAVRSALRRYSAIVVTPDLPAACELANLVATEHLQIQTVDDAACLERIRHAGAIFVGPDTPVPVGDYWAGPSHVLPTGGTAKFFSPLSVNDFLKSSSILAYDAAALRADGPGIAAFARREGLDAHAAAVERRLPGTDG